jgi:FAD/FMN-containing dehydrogenase
LDDALSDLDSAREEIERLRRENLTFRAAQKACELCGPNSPVWIDGKPANVEAEVVALRTDLDDALDVLRHLRRLQKDVREPEETTDEWWDQVLRAGRDADTVLARFDIKTTE